MSLDRTSFCIALMELQEMHDKLDAMNKELGKFGFSIEPESPVYTSSDIVLKLLASAHGTMGYDTTLDILEWAIYEGDFCRKLNSTDVRWMPPNEDLTFNIGPVNFIELYRYLEEDFDYCSAYYNWNHPKKR